MGRLLPGLAVGLSSCCVCAEVTVRFHPTVSGAGDLDGTVVYLVAASPPAHRPQKPHTAVTQYQRQFSPYIKVVQRGTVVEFPNRDPIAHHVYSFSKTQPFDLPLYKKDESVPSLMFETPGVVVLGCNVHDWMVGYLVVVDTPYFSQLQQQNALFEALPRGDDQLLFWHPGLHLKENTVRSVIIDGATRLITVNLNYPVADMRQPQAPEQQFDKDDQYP